MAVRYDSWAKFYQKEQTFLSRIQDILAHIEMLFFILASRPRLILEAGCGTATHSLVLVWAGINCIALDNDLTVVQNAARNIKNSRISFVVADIFHMPFRKGTFDVCFNQGLLEHLSPEGVVRLLREEAEVARRVIASVPSDNYPTKDFGDEMLLSPNDWSRMIFDRMPHKRGSRLRYYYLDLQSLKASLFRLSLQKPWHILLILRQEIRRIG